MVNTSCSEEQSIFREKTSSAQEAMRAESSASSVTDLQEPAPNNWKQRATEQPERAAEQCGSAKRPRKVGELGVMASLYPLTCWCMQ